MTVRLTPKILVERCRGDGASCSDGQTHCGTWQSPFLDVVGVWGEVGSAVSWKAACSVLPDATLLSSFVSFPRPSTDVMQSVSLFAPGVFIFGVNACILSAVACTAL